MRLLSLTLVFGLALAAAPLDACNLDPIKTQGTLSLAVQRGLHLIGHTDDGKIIAVDLLMGKTFDLGKADGVRGWDADVANGKALLFAGESLRVVSLAARKTLHEIPIGKERVFAFGFAGDESVFVHRGKSLAIIDIASGKRLQTIALGDTDDLRRFAAWQKIGDRLFIAGPATTLCVIDLKARKLVDRFSVDARAGMGSIQVVGSKVFCLGSQYSWAFQLDHMVCLDMTTRKCTIIDLPNSIQRFGGARLAAGSGDSVYVVQGNHFTRISVSGEHRGTFDVAADQHVVGVFLRHAVVAGKNDIRFVDIKEKPIVRK